METQAKLILICLTCLFMLCMVWKLVTMQHNLSPQSFSHPNFCNASNPNFAVHCSNGRVAILIQRYQPKYNYDKTRGVAACTRVKSQSCFVYNSQLELFGSGRI